MGAGEASGVMPGRAPRGSAVGFVLEYATYKPAVR